jgi:hypothetical protein
MNNDPDRNIPIRRRGRPKTIKIHREFKFHKSLFGKLKVRTDVRTKEAAFSSRLSTIEIESSRNFLDVRKFLNSTEKIVTGNIKKELARNKNLKVNLILFAEFKKNEELQQMNFRTQNAIVKPASNLAEFYEEATQKIFNEMEE